MHNCQSFCHQCVPSCINVHIEGEYVGICIYACVYIVMYLNTRPHISYIVHFLCLHSLFACLYIGFHGLYNKDVVFNSRCIYFPEVLFLLLF